MRLVCKILFFVFVLPFNIFSAQAPLIEVAVVIVGNSRVAGGCLSSIEKMVGQDEADFTYTTKFLGQRVVSVDIAPCAILDVEHVQDDFLTTTRFTLNSQEMVILEWFPPSISTLRDNPMTKAIAKAFQILKPGGSLIIDNHPFFAFTTADGIISQVQKQTNPFTLVLDASECNFIHTCLLAVLYDATHSLSPQNPTLLCLDILNRIFGKENKVIASELLGLLDVEPSMLESFVHDVSGMGYMFLWGWHTFTCAGLVGNCLEKIGFNCEKSQFGIVELNPLNNRKWASMLQVCKPDRNKEYLRIAFRILAFNAKRTAS